MKPSLKKQSQRRTRSAEVQADILRSAVASFRIEKLTISPEQAAAALRRAEAMLERSSQ